MYRALVWPLTAQAIKAWNWCDWISWDNSANNIDPHGMLETTDYEIFTMPEAGFLEVKGYVAGNTAGTGTLEVYLNISDPVDGDTPFLPFYPYSMGWNGNSFWSSSVRLTIPVDAGQQFKVRWYQAGGGNVNLKTDGHSYLELVLWGGTYE